MTDDVSDDMADDMTGAQQRFTAAVDNLALPRVDLVEGVLNGIAVHPRDRRARTGVRPGLRPALMLLLVIGVGAALIPTGRAVADWLGIGATVVRTDDLQRRPSVPTEGEDPGPAPQAGEAAPSVGALGRRLQPGAEVEVDLAPIAGLGPVGAVFEDPDRGRSYVWFQDAGLPAIADTDIGLVLSVRPIDGAGLAVKSLAADQDVEVVTVDRADGPVVGLWIPGSHELFPAGADRGLQARRVLLWEEDGIEYRLESEVSLDDSLELAREVAGGTDLLPPG